MAGIDSYTKLMLHMNGLDGSTTFTDDSLIPKTVNANGAAQIDTAQYEFGGASGLFNGADTTYLSTDDSDDFAFGTGDFTIDCWIRIHALPSSPAYKYICGQRVDNNNRQVFRIYYYSSKYYLQYVVGDTIIGVSQEITPVLDTWYHIAIVRNGNNFKLFWNGTQLGSDTVSSASITNVAAPFLIGCDISGSIGTNFNGWIDEFRISKGIARWTSNFTPPTEEYTGSRSKKTILSDAKIKVTDIQSTILSDAKIIIRETIVSDAKIVIEVLSNINSYINTVKQVLSDINNKVNTVIRVLSDVNCFINTCKSVISDFNNDFRTKKLTLNNVNNDVRFIYSWQRAADNSFQSLGKSYIRVYIATVEQTDVDVDSINISKDLNNSHTASFDLGRAYDATKPTIESIVEIKYNDWTLYKGYITEISPAEDPEKMRINCQDEYWKQNKSNVYYHVGHAPADNKELYYSTIKTALSTEHGWNLSIGDFIPQEINNFGVGKSEGISNLIQEIGNYGWFYDVDGTKKLWIAGEGNIIDLERQTLGTNINLYQIINHSFTDSVDGLVNKYRVQMGDKVIRALNETGNSRTYAGYNYSSYNAFLSPAWDSQYENIVTPENPGSGEGWNYHKPEHANLYKDVFKKYYMPYLDSKLSSWSDRYPAYVDIYSDWATYGASNGRLYEGFTIDYENKTITFNNPIYQYLTNSNGEIIAVRAPSIKVFLWKKNYYTYTVDPTDDPETDISNPLMFFTAKMGSYADTIIKDLNLSNLSIQEGGSYTKESQSTSEVQIYDGVNSTFTLEHTGQTAMAITVNCVILNPANYSYNSTAGTVTITSPLVADDYLTFYYDYIETVIIPSWDDTDFAEDLANWNLSKLCDKKIKGTIEITLDALCYYNIDLTNRIYIDGITESIMNITNIDYDLSNFTVRLTLENSRNYTRTVSYSSHGE